MRVLQVRLRSIGTGSHGRCGSLFFGTTKWKQWMPKPNDCKHVQTQNIKTKTSKHTQTHHMYTQNKLAPVKKVYRFTRLQKPPCNLFSRLASPSYVPTHSTRAQQGPNNRLQGVFVQVVNFDGFHFHQQVCHLSISSTLKT